MRRIYPQIPDSWDCVTVGFIVESDDPDDLSEDMVDVELPNGVVVSVGVPMGEEHYVLTALSGLSHVVPPLTVLNAMAAAEELSGLVDALRAHSITSNSESEYLEHSEILTFVSG